MAKEGSSEYKKVREMVLCGTKNGCSMASLEEPFKHLYF